MTKKTFSGWAIIDKRSNGRICMSSIGTPLIFFSKSVAKAHPYSHLDTIKKVKIIIEE